MAEAGADDAGGTIWTRTRFTRADDELEFARVANFADAVYAIALTLIVVGIGVPEGMADESSTSELLDELSNQLPSIITFFVVFIVVGNYWMAHHRYFSWLGAIDGRFMRLQLVYLAVIAFLPFPAALLGRLDSNPIALAFFALAMACASALETVMIGHAHRAGLMRERLSEKAYRWERFASLSAVVVFLVSIPFAFIAVWIAVLFWFANSPLGILLDRRRPEEFRPHR